MNLARLLRKRAEEGRPVRVGVIGAGKFSSMFLAQARTTPGMHLLALADLDEGRARDALERTGWDVDAQVTRDFDEARRTGRTAITAASAMPMSTELLPRRLSISGVMGWSGIILLHFLLLRKINPPLYCRVPGSQNGRSI